MSVLELKGNILQLLARLENQSHLVKLQELATKFVEKEVSAHDIEGYDDLSPEQQIDLLESIAQTYDESKLIPHDEVLKRFDRWLTK
jgi:bisphosphoglycerate-independent phosphoglycerate mutase (AlkP superfamily)